MNFSEISYGLRSTFYALSPQQTFVEHFRDVPSILALVVPLSLVVSLAEGVCIVVLGEAKQWNLHNVIINILTGSLVTTWNVFFLRGLELTVYIWCYNTIRIFTLPWNGFNTYIIALLGVDFCTYWWHRASHEISFVWAAHSSHHSGEDFNLSTSNRVSTLIRFTKWMHYLPLGILGIPPTVFVIHSQMNFVFGLWGHSLFFPKMHKIIPGLGHIIEYLMVTPSHHRVHHGSNKYCLDKNYGALLIIWDRMFGTFAEEREDEPITYGTISQLDTFHVVGIQLEPFEKLFNKMKMMKTTGDKIRSLAYGPAWLPGQPRLGDAAAIPDVRGRKKKEISLPLWLNTYLTLHGALIAFMCKEMGSRVRMFNQWQCLVNFLLVLVSCTALGGFYDSKSYSLWLEPLRLILLVAVSHLYPVFSGPTTTLWASGLCLGSLLYCPAFKSYLQPSSSTTRVHKKKNRNIRK